MTPDAIVEFAQDLAKVAASGGGPAALTATLAKRCGAGVLLEDAQRRPIATAGPGSLPATSRGLGVEVATIVPVGIGGAPIGWLSLFGDQAQRASFAPALRLAASTIAVELSRNGAGLRGKKHEFWEALLAGAYHDTAAARADALARGITFADNYVCIALEAEQNSAELRALVTDALRSVPGEVAFIEQGSVLLAVVPAAREIDAENAKTVAQLLPKNAVKRGIAVRVKGGVSGALPALELARGAREANAALAIASRMYATDAVATHEELGAYPLIFSGASVEELREFAGRTLAQLRAYDEKHQTELERTLRTYFSTGMNVKDTAAELNVHRHTVFYRLRQIGDISGRSLESDHDQLTLRLAIAIDALHT